MSHQARASDAVGTQEPDHRYDFWTDLDVEFDEDLLLSEQHVRNAEFEEEEEEDEKS